MECSGGLLHGMFGGLLHGMFGGLLFCSVHQSAVLVVGSNHSAIRSIMVSSLGAHVMYDCMAVTVAWHAHTS